MSDTKWYVGAQNDCLYIIDQPPRPSNDDINPDRECGVIAKVYQQPEEDGVARVLAAAPELLAACKAQAALIARMVELQGIAPDTGARTADVAIMAGNAIRKAEGKTSERSHT